MGRAVPLSSTSTAVVEEHDERFLEWKLHHLYHGAVREPREYTRTAGGDRLRSEADALGVTLAQADDDRKALGERLSAREALLGEMGLLDRAERHVQHMLRARKQWARPGDWATPIMWSQTHRNR